MKKLLSILLAAMLIVACFGMVGCGVEGKYKFYAYEIAGEQYKVGDEVPGLGKITEEMAKESGFELAKDGVVKDADGEEVESASWEEADGKVTIKIGDFYERELTKDGRKLIEDLGNGVKIIYKK